MSEITIRVDEIEKIDFLDGFRGTLAIWVLMMHSTYALKVNKYFRGTGSYIGVPCFFILSSFLLTYRLLNQFNNDKNKEIFKNKKNLHSTRKLLYDMLQSMQY